MLTIWKSQGRGRGLPGVGCKRRNQRVSAPFPGARVLVALPSLQGAVPDTPETCLTGAALAQIHHHRAKLHRPRQPLCAGRTPSGGPHAGSAAIPSWPPTVLDAYRELIPAFWARLKTRTLTRVMCHGDTHGFQQPCVLRCRGCAPRRLLDFDDAGPGFLAYDLCDVAVVRPATQAPWTRRSLAPALAAVPLWLTARGGGHATDADLAALPLFVQLRHLWNMGRAWRASTTGAPT